MTELRDAKGVKRIPGDRRSFAKCASMQVYWTWKACGEGHAVCSRVKIERKKKRSKKGFVLEGGR